MSAAGPEGGGRVTASDAVLVAVWVPVLVGVALLGGTSGRLFVAGIVLLTVLARRGRSGPLGRTRVRLDLVGSLVLAVGAMALWLGRIDVVALALVACGVDAVVAYLGLRRLEVAAATARIAVAGDTLEVMLRVHGRRGPVWVRLLDPLGEAVPVTGDRPVAIAHVAEHRGVYSHIRVELATSGWMSTVTARRLLAIPLDAPITVWPRSLAVDVTVEPEAADDVAGLVPARRGGEAEQVRSLRPYTPGDPRRRVHWPTTARRGELSVVEVDADTRRSAHIAVVLPGLPCGLDHPGTHADHLDVVTGQARYTVERLLADGVPVVLTTVEVDESGETSTVTAALRSRTELGTRLACAAAGVPDLSEPQDPWVLGPDRGPARRASEIEHGATSTDLAVPAEGRAAGSGQEAADAAGDLRQSIVAVCWLATMFGFVAATAAVAFGSLGPLALALIAISVCVVLTGRKLTQLSLWWALDVALLGATAAWLTTRGSAGPVPLAVVLAVVWCLPRLIGLRMLPAGPGRSGPWSATVATALVAAGLTTATLVPSSAIVVVVTVVVAAGLLIARVAAAPARDEVTSREAATTAAAVAGRTAVVSALTLLLLPLVAAGMQERDDRLDGAGSSSAGGGASASWLGDRDTLDLTQPRPGADRLVLTVEADRPALLRDTSYDVWDGQVWSASPFEVGQVLQEPDVFEHVRGPDQPASVAPVALQLDPGGTSSRPVPSGESETHGRSRASGTSVTDAVSGSYRQRITVHANGAASLPAAAEPIEVRSDGYVVALTDGNLRTSPPVPRGEVYEVVSEVPSWSDADLRRASAGRVPTEVRERFAGSSGLSRRVIDDVHAATEGAATTYDQVRALEAWLGEQVSYSLDAPLPPPGVDVVDHFLYDAREGWCQQIATAMTLMLREIDVPARLVTGFAATEWDGQRFVVRERHAHAWVEVYLPGIGWYELDPTQVVPLAAEQQDTTPTSVETDPRLWIVAAVVLLALLAAWGVVRTVTRRRARTHPDEPTDPRPWATATAQRLEALGTALGRERRPEEGVVEHAQRLADRLGEPRLTGVGRLVERDAYDRDELDAPDRHDVDGLLDELEQAVASSDAAAVGAFSAASPPPPTGSQTGSQTGSSPVVEARQAGGGPPPPPGPDRR